MSSVSTTPTALDSELLIPSSLHPPGWMDGHRGNEAMHHRKGRLIVGFKHTTSHVSPFKFGTWDGGEASFSLLAVMSSSRGRDTMADRRCAGGEQSIPTHTHLSSPRSALSPLQPSRTGWRMREGKGATSHPIIEKVVRPWRHTTNHDPVGPSPLPDAAPS